MNNIYVDYIGTRMVSIKEFPSTIVRVLFKPESNFKDDIPYHKVVEHFSSQLEQVKQIYLKFHQRPVNEYTVVRTTSNIYLEVIYNFPHSSGGEKKALQFAKALSEL